MMDATRFTAYPTGNLCNADPAVQPLSASIRPLLSGRRIAGPARTVRISAGQNRAIHAAVHSACRGEVLVVDGGAARRFGPFGDLLAECCMLKGMAGAVFDCTIRDSGDIAALGFPVFSLGFHPEATGKVDPGETDIVVTVGGVEVRPGDIIVGDDDGVVAIPAGLAEEVLEKVSEVAAREESNCARIRAGETTFEIFNLAD